jgi:hypothetical protein
MLDKIENSHEQLIDMVEMVEEMGMLPPDVYADLLVCIGTHKELGKAKEPVRKEYLFNFKEGGWNSVYALNKTQAIKSAKEEWKNSEGLTVDVKSFRRSTPTESKQLMSNFY